MRWDELKGSCTVGAFPSYNVKESKSIEQSALSPFTIL